jgi:hypothetical protein
MRNFVAVDGLVQSCRGDRSSSGYLWRDWFGSST